MRLSLACVSVGLGTRCVIEVERLVGEEIESVLGVDEKSVAADGETTTSTDDTVFPFGVITPEEGALAPPIAADELVGPTVPLLIVVVRKNTGKRRA